MAGYLAPTSVWRKLKADGASAARVLRYFGFYDPPVDVRQLAGFLGVVVQDYPNLECSGIVDPRSDPARIWLKAEEPETRKRFTLAHEIGHLMLHPEAVARRDTTFQGSLEEAQANGYAANLLMPLWMLSRLAPRYHYDAHRLAELFQVSDEAMNIRLLKLAGVPHDWEREYGISGQDE